MILGALLTFWEILQKILKSGNFDVCWDAWNSSVLDVSPLINGVMHCLKICKHKSKLLAVKIYGIFSGPKKGICFSRE